MVDNIIQDIAKTAYNDEMEKLSYSVKPSKYMEDAQKLRDIVADHYKRTGESMGPVNFFLGTMFKD